MIRDSAGNLYGTTQFTGRSGEGVVYKIDTSGKQTVLYSFCSQANCADREYPQAGVIRDSAGNLYGTTYKGGVSGAGFVFLLRP